MHTVTCQIATAKQQGQLPTSSFSPCRSHFESSLYSAAAVCTTGTLGIFISCQIWVEVLKGSVVLGQRHTLCTLFRQKKLRGQLSQVFPKIPTRLYPPRKHHISYCRSFLQYPFQKCKCRPPSATSNKLITVYFQRSSRLSSQLNH